MLCTSKSFVPLLLILAIDLVCSSTAPETCEAGLGNGRTMSSLIQASNRQKAVSLKQGQKSIRNATARSILPESLFELGLKLLKKEEILDAVVDGTEETSSSYAGVDMQFRMVKGDGVDSEDVYGVNSLDETIADGESMFSNGMINMVDIGGNYGRVSIAAFKLHPMQMRILVVEPVPITHFLLRWNLWLNGVRELTETEFREAPTSPGVLVLDRGISKSDGEQIGLCYKPPETMVARLCGQCSEEGFAAPEDGVEQCYPVEGISVESLLKVFGTEPISFFKMDCEGCETEVIPALQAANQKIHRFGGELHAATNSLEDFACKFEGGIWFVHVCYIQATDKYEALELSERCKMDEGRAPCSA